MDPDYGFDWMHVIAPEPGGGDCESAWTTDDEPSHPDCPHGDPMHDHGDGCPSCDIEQCPACRCIRGKLAAGEECPGCVDRFGGGM